MRRPLLFVSLLGLALLVALALWSPWRRPAPEVVRPAPYRDLDPAVAALVERTIARVLERPREAGAHGDLGLVYEANQLWAEARACFETAVALDPSHPGWRLHLALAARQTGDHATARTLLETLARDAPDLPAVHERLGEARLEAGDLDGAARAFQRVIDLAPQQSNGYTRLGDVLLQQGRVEEALALLEQAVSLDPEDRQAFYLLGRAYQRLGRADEAEAALAKGRDATPRYLPDPLSERVQRYAVNLPARLERAGWLLQAGHPDQAATLLQQALRDHPDNPDVLNNLAVAYLHMNRLDEAHTLLERARALDDRRFGTYLNLASWALRTGDPARALAYAEDALARAPDQVQIQMTRAQALAALDRTAEALAAAEDAHRLAPDQAAPLALAGDLLLQLDRPAEAAGRYREALRLDPDLLPALIGLTRAALRLGQTDEARRTFERARRLAPEHPYVARLTRQFQDRP
ncbi:MAG: hypothetical protein KatS3mg042_1606 [Rhodothermaceae bacterium]|nr:MAG: hypothetical protein KatS3mg042_1606 [Rhodothermaceae bacterium]